MSLRWTVCHALPPDARRGASAWNHRRSAWCPVRSGKLPSYRQTASGIRAERYPGRWKSRSPNSDCLGWSDSDCFGCSGRSCLEFACWELLTAAGRNCWVEPLCFADSGSDLYCLYYPHCPHRLAPKPFHWPAQMPSRFFCSCVVAPWKFPLPVGRFVSRKLVASRRIDAPMYCLEMSKQWRVGLPERRMQSCCWYNFSQNQALIKAG